MNGNGAGENVTVTHYSEERGTMEKISVPPLNLFNVDVAPDQAADQQRSTNPFLNMSPTANSTPVVTTNPFRSPNDSDKPAAAAVKSTNGTLSTNHTTSKIPVPISLNSSNGNGNHIIEPVTPVATNPFTTLSEIDGGAKVIAMNRQNSIKRTNSKLKYANNNSVSYANSKNNNGKSNEDGIIASEVSWEHRAYVVIHDGRRFVQLFRFILNIVSFFQLSLCQLYFVHHLWWSFRYAAHSLYIDCL